MVYAVNVLDGAKFFKEKQTNKQTNKTATTTTTTTTTKKTPGDPAIIVEHYLMRQNPS